MSCRQLSRREARGIAVADSIPPTLNPPTRPASPTRLPTRPPGLHPRPRRHDAALEGERTTATTPSKALQQALSAAAAHF